MNDRIIIGGHEFPVLVAVTEAEQARGLMFRIGKPPVMIFPYKKAQTVKFWMKNTYCPLDIVFCKENSVTGVYQGMPLSTLAVGPDTPSDLIVELPAGTSAKLGIRPGDPVKVSYSIDTIAKRIVV
jgi:uncharacterized protein